MKTRSLSIHDVGAGGLSNALPELVHDGGSGRASTCAPSRSGEPGLSPARSCGATRRRSATSSRSRRQVGELRGALRARALPVGRRRHADRGWRARAARRPLPQQADRLAARRLLRQAAEMHAPRAHARAGATPLDLAGDRIADALHRVLAHAVRGGQDLSSSRSAIARVGGLVLPRSDGRARGRCRSRTAPSRSATSTATPARPSRSASARPSRCSTPPRLARWPSARRSRTSPARRSASCRRSSCRANWMAAPAHPGEDARLYAAVRRRQGARDRARHRDPGR